MAVNCFTCGDTGHLAAQCRNTEVLDTRPRWCGICDPRTRLVTIDLQAGTVRKCRDCHPAPAKPAVQHKRCGNCQMTVYAWDTNPCGQHLSPAAPDRRLPLDAIHEITGSNS